MNTLKARKRDQNLNGRSNPWLELIAQMGDQLSACEQQSDETDAFVSTNYDC